MLDTKKYLDSEQIPYIENYQAAKLCSFRVGGEVAIAVFPKTRDQFASAVDFLTREGKRHVILGRGSNVVLPDGSYNGAVLLTQDMSAVRISGTTVFAEAGATLFSLARSAEVASLSGLEFAHGIPGSVGGGVYMNAGAYGGELSDRLVSCECYDAQRGQFLTLKNGECGFSYRDSIFQKRKELKILSAEFLLERGDRNEIRAKMNELKAARAEKQPLEYPSAGSTFKRPEGHFAGKLIEDCGLKGVSVGGAAVSEKHAGFVINKGGATSADIAALVKLIKDTVLERYGVLLECEIEFI